MDFGFAFFRVLHGFNLLQYAMYVPSAGLDTDSVGPANLEMAYGSSIALANIQQPVENVVVVLGVCDDFVCAVEDGCGFDVYEVAGAEERCICWDISGRVATIDDAFLERIGVPFGRSSLGVIMFGLS